ncbi:MAG: glycosyltransferase family 1 protein [Pyrinomonadaceae bacterium]|nr:glycosyltransferase family 1 protein [Pyrinomonadaceae bacterium]
MKVLVLTIGSRGDVQPYLALAKGLKDAGHEVLLATASSFEEFVTREGVDFFPMSNGLVELLTDDLGREAIEELKGLFGAVKTHFKLIKTIKPIMRELVQDCWEAADGFRPDFIVYNSKVPGADLAEALKVTCALAIPFPQLVPSSEMPTLGFPNVGPLNRSSYGLVRLFMGLYSGFVNKFRTETLGLPKRRRFGGLHHAADGTPLPVLHCFSEHVVPRPSDWPDCAYVTGYWFLKDETEPSKELVDFLEEGDPPVYVGFGSMSGRKPEKVTAAVIEALKAANVRGIVATGWGGLKASDLPDSILKIDQAPHEWLFPRVAAVVHHGGAGTTAAGLRAGKPTIICPFFGDQGFWGNRVYELGVGSKPIPQRKLTAEKLTKAIKLVTEDESVEDRAKGIGDLISSEDGIARAVSVIEKVQNDDSY